MIFRAILGTSSEEEVNLVLTPTSHCEMTAGGAAPSGEGRGRAARGGQRRGMNEAIPALVAPGAFERKTPLGYSGKPWSLSCDYYAEQDWCLTAGVGKKPSLSSLGSSLIGGKGSLEATATGQPC